jgi:hypothetical protein
LSLLKAPPRVRMGGLWPLAVCGGVLVSGGWCCSGWQRPLLLRLPVQFLLGGERRDYGVALFRICASSAWLCTVVRRGSRLHFPFRLRESAAIGRRYGVLRTRTRRQGAFFGHGLGVSAVSAAQVQSMASGLLDPSSASFSRLRRCSSMRASATSSYA